MLSNVTNSEQNFKKNILYAYFQEALTLKNTEM